MANNFTLSDYYDLVENGYENDDIYSRLTNESISLVGWYDHLAEFADVRVEKELGLTDKQLPIVQHTRFDGNVFQQGTPVNAENLGQMEWNDLINFMRIQELVDYFRTLQVQVATMMGQNINNMPYNSFVASVKNIDSDIIILEGWYDEATNRGVLD